MSSLKQKTLTGLKWSAFERFGTQGISFIITIIIARILSPSDYGILGMIAIFLALSRVFIEAGFGTALIRKQDRTQTDFSTVFYYNVAVSLLFYILLFITAPLIAGFYDMTILVPVTRVVGINIIIGAFGAIHRTKLSIDLNFKLLAKISIVSIIFTGAIGIFLAYKGYGVWALIIQHLTSTILTTGLL
ncbi:MAG: oligosaccharide flippase family protein, partial [Bacteroidales bacterium]|nr:oligosaccharide flippase family protein [Bacteroidales bacterium]